MYDFNSISNRLLQADFQDHTAIVSKFIEFIKNTPIIYKYIEDCGPCEQDIEQEFDVVRSSYGGCIFTLGDTSEEEIRNVYAILCYISNHDIETFRFVAMGYSVSDSYQEKIKGFNNRVIMVLIRHIETFLTKIGIDMGLDEKTTYSITVHSGQVNVASDNASITAISSVGIDAGQLADLVKDIRIAARGLSIEDAEILESSLEVVEIEAKADKPRKGFLKTAISGLKALKGTAEFAAAVVALVQFLQPLI